MHSFFSRFFFFDFLLTIVFIFIFMNELMNETYTYIHEWKEVEKKTNEQQSYANAKIINMYILKKKERKKTFILAKINKKQIRLRKIMTSLFLHRKNKK